MRFDNTYLSQRLWQGVASVYALLAFVALFGVIGLLEGEIIPGLLIIGVTTLLAASTHKLIKHYLKGRNY